MTAKTITEIKDKENIVDDIIDSPKDTSDLDQDKLAALKAKMAAKKKDDMPAKIIAKKERSLNFGILGSGQGGGRICESFYKAGYSVAVCNTATQDLKLLEIPESSKLLLNYLNLGGASRDLEIGKLAAEANKEAISQLVSEKLNNSDAFIIASSLAGGSGSGSLEILIDILQNFGKPIIVIGALPMESEDTLAKSNSLKTMAMLTNSIQSKKIVNAIIVDNAKIEAILSNVNQFDFFRIANDEIVNHLNAFNTYSMMPSPTKGIDSMELAKILFDGAGLSIYGSTIVKDFAEDTAIAEAIINNLDSGMLAGGFDLKRSKYAAVIMAAPKNVWSKISSAAQNYGLSMVNDTCGSATIFKGSYIDEEIKDHLKIYFMFSGLSIPSARIEELKKASQEHVEIMKNKNSQRSADLTINLGESTALNANDIKAKIASKASAFGKFTQNIVDKRK